MKPLKITVIAASAVLFIAFFLPWVKIMMFSLSAWDLITVEPSRTPLRADLLFLFPISAIVNIIMTATSNKTSALSRLFRLLPTLLIVGAFISVMMKGGLGGSASGMKGIFQVIGIGVYLTLLSSLTLLATAFMKESAANPVMFSQEPASPAAPEAESSSNEPQV